MFFHFANISFDIIAPHFSSPKDFHEKVIDPSNVNAGILIWQELSECNNETAKSISVPTCFADLLSLYGLLHSVGTWDEDCIFMLNRLCYTPKDMISFRDDVFRYYVDHNILEKDAWRFSEYVRKGKGVPFFNDEMLASRDMWVLSRLEQIKYLCPKAHTVEYLFFRLKLTV